MSKSPFLRSRASGPTKCWCGTRIALGAPVFRAVPAGETSEFLFRNHVFCSAKCLRSFCLVSLETLDALERPASREVVSDLHELRRELSETLTSILDEQNQR
jgi:hypothetical protein